MRIINTAGFLALSATLAFAEPEAGTTRTEDLLEQMQDSFRTVADDMFSSLVYIEAVSGDQSSTGSGFIVDHDTGTNTFYVATNHHVAGGSFDWIQVTTRDGRPFEAVLVGSDPRYDIALLSFEYSTDGYFDWTPSISGIGDSDAVQAGDLVYAVGSPQGLPETVTLGIVSHVSRESPLDVGVFIQTDTAINPGNSGGPLVSLRDGNVIGINTWIRTPVVASGGDPVTTTEGDLLFAFGSVGLGFAVPINTAMRIIGNLREHGAPRHGYIGVEYSPWGAKDVLASCSPTSLVNAGWDVDWDVDWDGEWSIDWDNETWDMIMVSLTTIMNLTPLAPADRHGLKPGDVISLVDGEFAPVIANIDRPPSHSKLVRMIDALTPGEDSVFEVIRDCEYVEITLQAGVREEEEANVQTRASWPGMLLDAGLSVAAVTDSGVASSLGIDVGDVITHVNGDRIENLGQFYLGIDACRSERCSLGVYRNGILSWTSDFVVPRE